LSVVSLLAWNGFHLAVVQSTNSLTQSARVGDEFAAQVFADHIAMAVDRRWRIMEHQADSPEFQAMVIEAAGKPRQHQARAALQRQIEALHGKHDLLPSVTWLVFGPDGTMLARSPLEEKMLDEKYAFHDFFHGRGHRLPRGAQTAPLTEVHRSIIYRTQATGPFRAVAFSVPIWNGETDQPGRRVVGVLVSSVEVGDIVDFRPPVEPNKEMVPVLIDTRADEHGKIGSILIHPYLAELHRRDPNAPLPEIHIDSRAIKRWEPNYHDPVAHFDPQYGGRWLAASDFVEIEGRGEGVRNTGLLVIMQERYDSVIGPVIELKRLLVERGALTLIVIILMLTALWGLVIGVLDRPSKRRFSSLWRGRESSSGSLTATSGRSVGSDPASIGASPASGVPPAAASALAAGEAAPASAEQGEPAP
jgi:hypothetical protein